MHFVNIIQCMLFACPDKIYLAILPKFHEPGFFDLMLGITLHVHNAFSYCPKTLLVQRHHSSYSHMLQFKPVSDSPLTISDMCFKAKYNHFISSCKNSHHLRLTSLHYLYPNPSRGKTSHLLPPSPMVHGQFRNI